MITECSMHVQYIFDIFFFFSEVMLPRLEKVLGTEMAGDGANPSEDVCERPGANPLANACERTGAHSSAGVYKFWEPM